ncbi:tetratricopeptide repeat protein [Insolitispirillum peregrinum]|uniref:Tetratricopeptide repeat-containing protein n=1 Tax=Insolitispirillum peregrinum TaxID=80876 RepID=A0A1N7NIF3_9PROT|nr:tetratricopeptide repeat protein [Insolitispirillum peregrinum]SIS98203.1 Tetratricopeptide repeat-containing protein [Insolitispirillum peregrinum]
MSESFDVFLSYARSDSALADPLVTALEQAGVRVWRDTRQIDTFADIQRAISDGLSRSKVLLALYSRAYTTRRACDWELAAAFVSGGADRILVLNPEHNADHIEPQSLREALFAGQNELSHPATLVNRIKARTSAHSAPFGALVVADPQQKWIGLPPNGGAQTFVGRRAELWRVHDGLDAGSVLLAPTTAGTAPGDGSTLLCGLGGMGKTLLAEEYARRFAAAWPGGIFWLRAGGPLEDQYQTLAREMGIAFDPALPGDLKRAITTAMKARPGRYLWVVDDLPHGLKIEQARAWFAPTAQGRSLITTRSRTLDSIARAVELAELDEQAAMILLTLDRPPGTEADRQAAHAILDALGRHALAVDLARHLVKRQGYGKVLADLQNPDKEALALAERLSVELPTGHSKSIAQTFLSSIQTLDDSALDVLRIAACLAPHTPIPRDLVSAILVQADGVNVDQAEEDALIAIDQAAAQSLCDDTDTAYQVHALVCRTIATRYADKRSQILAQASLAVLMERFKNVADTRNHRGVSPILTHAHAIIAGLKTYEQIYIGNQLGIYYNSAGLYQEALAVQYDVINAFESTFGINHENTLSSISNLAITLYSLGQLTAAEKIFQQVLNARRCILGSDHLDTLKSIGKLAGVYLELGQLTQAREMQQYLVDAHLHILGSDHPDTLNSMSGLAVVLLALGELTSAKKIQQAVLDTCPRVLGPDHPDTLSYLSNMAAILRVLGDVIGAEGLQRKVLHMLDTTFGPEHPATLNAILNLSETIRFNGNFACAKEMQQQALKVYRRIFGPDHPTTLTCLNNLAGTLQTSGDWAESQKIHEQVLDARFRIFGPDHPSTLTSMNNLADIFRAQGNLARAKDMHQQVLDAQLRTHGLDHPSTLTSMNNLAGTQNALGNHTVAREIQQRVLNARRRVFGLDHPTTLTATFMLAQYIALSGDLAAAIPLATEAAQGLLTKLGPDHPDTQTAHRILTVLQSQQNSAPAPD